MKNASHTLLLALFVVSTALFTACDRRQSHDADAAFSVYVVNYPLYYFASRIGGEQVAVFFPAPDDVDPAEWIPEDRIIQRYQAADLIILNGADYAGWTELVTLPESALVDAAANIQDRFIEEEELIHHSHGPHGEHTHGGTAFTLWLDPNLAIEQARSIQLALASALPQYAELFEQRFTQLMEDLLALDSALKAAIGDNAARPVLVSHPVYQYLEARYALNAVSFHWEPDEMPTEAEWRELAHILENHPARWMIWEDEPLPQIAARLQAAGVATVVFNPTSQPPEAGDFLSAMQANAEALRIVYAD